MAKRKRQITREVINPQADKVLITVDMGWSDPKWASLKAKSLTWSVLALGDESWTVFRVTHEDEDAFTKRLERIFNGRGAESEYFVIRAQEHPNEPVLASFFIRGLSLSDIWFELKPYITDKPIPFSGDELVGELHRLFDPRQHPDVKNIRRWSASRSTIRKLRLARMTMLIDMARKEAEHDLVENLPTMLSFERRVAKYTKADLPLMHKLTDEQVRELLAVCVQMNLLSEHEATEILRWRTPSGEWTNWGMYAGLPKHGIERDEGSGSYMRHFMGKHSASEIRIDGKTLAEAEWEPYAAPEVSEGERYLE